jgi:type IV secretion system protein VirD4
MRLHQRLLRLRRPRPLALACRFLLTGSVGMAGLSAAALAIKFPVYAAIPVGLIVYRQWKQWKGGGYVHGTARATCYGELLAHRYVGHDEGLIVGTAGYVDPPGKLEGLAALLNPAINSVTACSLAVDSLLGSRLTGNSIIRIHDYIHGGLFAPPGTGKNTGFLIVNGLAYPGSIFFNDPQGSIYSAVAKHRQRKFSHRQVPLDPFNLLGRGGDGLNPIDFVPPVLSPDFLDYCRSLAEMLVFRKGTEPDPYWNAAAERVITTFICFIAGFEKEPSLRNLVTVQRLLASRECYLACLNVIKTHPDMPQIVRQQAETLSWMSGRELNSVMGVVQQNLNWLASPAVAACLSRSTFSPLELKENKIDVYTMLPLEQQVPMAAFLRVQIGTILRTITRGKADESKRVLCLIDEAPTLGNLQILQDSLALMRGYGLRVFLAFQSTGQVDKVYGDNARVIMDNLGTQLHWSVNSPDSCEYVSKAIGDYTESNITYNTGRSHSSPTGSPAREPSPGNVSTSSSVTYAELARRWVKPEEVRTSPVDLIWLFHKNHHVITAKLMPFFRAREFKWGGTGRSRGLGLAGLVLTAVVVAVAVMVSSLASSLLQAVGGNTSPVPAYRDEWPYRQVNLDPYLWP